MNPLLDIPFPLEDGSLVYLRLPRYGLTPRDTPRIQAALEALTLTPVCSHCRRNMSFDPARRRWRCHRSHAGLEATR